MKDFLIQSKVDAVTEWLKQYQQRVCDSIGQLDYHESFAEERWARSGKASLRGKGSTRVLSGGTTFERAGVNFSAVEGDSLPPSATERKPELEGSGFLATGVSIVTHPENTYVPTSHANLRLFVTRKENQLTDWWFGGGFDLTPYYGFEEDAVAWHEAARSACQPYGQEVYPRFKKWCDSYFFLKHRNEQCGIGGIFFDDLNEWPFDTCFSFLRDVGNVFLEAYLSIVKNRLLHTWGEREKAFQLYRRGRYVEFNLLYDRGTLFGLQSGGRTEAILMSMPPSVRWVYDWRPDAGSREEELYNKFLKSRDWLEME